MPDITTDLWHDLRNYLGLAALIALGVYGIVQGTKGLIKAALDGRVSPKLENALLRFYALVLGGVGGWLLRATWSDIGAWGGITAGLIGSAFATAVYAVVKAKIDSFKRACE